MRKAARRSLCKHPKYPKATNQCRHGYSLAEPALGGEKKVIYETGRDIKVKLLGSCAVVKVISIGVDTVGAEGSEHSIW